MASPQKNSKGLRPELASTLERLRVQGEERAAVQESATVYQLGFWPDSHRALPTDFLACALFA
ncbi:MAG TPA: hypothetical protein VGO84_02180, partial [Burkholderiales bacterium]|nr:hypothetical protein [Burkholderiales bacterium]